MNDNCLFPFLGPFSSVSTEEDWQYARNRPQKDRNVDPIQEIKAEVPHSRGPILQLLLLLVLGKGAGIG